MKKTIFNVCLAVLAGVTLGILSKWDDVIPGENLIKYFGRVSTGVVIWLVIGTFFLQKAKSRMEFSLFYSAFMVPMLIAYYAFSAIVVEYLVTRVIFFWIIVFAASLLFGNLIYNKRYTHIFKILYIAAVLIFIVYDAIVVNGVDLAVILSEAAVSLLLLVMIYRGMPRKKATIDSSLFLIRNIRKTPHSHRGREEFCFADSRRAHV